MLRNDSVWHIRDRVLHFGQRPLVMGIVNVTPDSFSDGGLYVSADSAIAHGLELVRQGADLLDIGGESSRPGAQPVSMAIELARVIPVVEALSLQTAAPLSIDTSKADIARAAIAAGAHIINDITALTGDPLMAETIQSTGAGAILMHMQGTPITMQRAPHYDDVVAQIGTFFEDRLHFALSKGIAWDRIVIDPGIGFGKRIEHNLEILARLDKFQKLGRPVCLGVSRKGFIGRMLEDRPVTQRVAGSLAIACFALGLNAVQVLRVHDVAATRDAVEVFSVLARVRCGAWESP